MVKYFGSFYFWNEKLSGSLLKRYLQNSEDFFQNFIEK